MKYSLICSIVLIFFFAGSCNTPVREKQNFTAGKTDSLPNVLPENRKDLIANKLRTEAALKFAEHQLPADLKDCEAYKIKLRQEIIDKAGVIKDHRLALNIKVTGETKLKGYSIKNISFQTRPGIYATANLYTPDGAGPFPGVINMLGHWRKGKIDNEGPQAVGHALAMNGYVCLSIDPWGSGERTTTHGDFEYHGANLGASLMNIGETLLGIQISDNMRGIDLLCSLPVVDSTKIGATGASGGGNQTMWLAATDERVKAAVPVVSVGTFESYIMESNCICELLPDGLTFTEESGVLSLSGALLLINHRKDSNPTFFPAEMERSFNNAKSVYKLEGRENNISYRLFDLEHGYMQQDREAMIGWFDLHLKGTGNGVPKKEIPFEQLPEAKLMVFPIGERDSNVVSTDEYCRKKGEELRTLYLDSKSFNAEQKKSELRAILRINEKPAVKNAKHLPSVGGWTRIALETTDKILIPLLIFPALNESEGYVIICNPDGKKGIALSLIDDFKKKGAGVVIADLSGTGELTSTSSLNYDNTAKLHTLSRAELWMGRSILGEWVKEIDMVTGFIYSEFKAQKVGIDGSREAGLAALFFCALDGKADNITLRDAPVSYLFDDRKSVDFFSMGIHLPGILKWGDVSLAAALCGKPVTFIDPLTMSGRKLNSTMLNQYQLEYEKIRKLCDKGGATSFN